MKRYIKARKQGHDKNLVQQACMSTLETQEKIWQKKKKKVEDDQKGLFFTARAILKLPRENQMQVLEIQTKETP